MKGGEKHRVQRSVPFDTLQNRGGRENSLTAVMAMGLVCRRPYGGEILFKGLVGENRKPEGR